MITIGIMGAARVASMAIVEPAARRSDVKVVAIAAKRAGSAAEFAAKHGIPVAYDSYEALIGNPSIDVIYNLIARDTHPPAS